MWGDDLVGVRGGGVESAGGDGERDVGTAYGAVADAYGKEREGYGRSLGDGATPPGGFVLRGPEGQGRPERVRIDGRSATWSSDELVIPAGARRVVLN